MNATLTRRAFQRAAGSIVAASALRGIAKAAGPALNFQSIWINDPEFIGYFIALDNGYFAAENLNINYMSGGPNLIPEGSLLTGKADIALTTVNTTAQLIADKGAPFKIIGTQFQKNPDSIISLEATGIKGPKDLIGKTLACAPTNLGIIKAMLIVNGIGLDQVKIVPYAFDPTPLATGSIDAVADFMTSLPFIVEQTSGKKTSNFLIDDAGLPLLIDTVTVTENTLKTRRPELVKFLRASRKGWSEDFADPTKYPLKYADTWFKGNGYTPEALLYHSKIQVPLMQNPKGMYTMDEDAIEANIATLSKIGIKAPRDMFDNSVLAEV